MSHLLKKLAFAEVYILVSNNQVTLIYLENLEIFETFLVHLHTLWREKIFQLFFGVTSKGHQCLWQKFLVLIESAKKPRFAAVEVHYSRSLSPVLELLLGWCYYLFRNMAFTTDVHCVLIEIRISTRVQNSLSLLSFPNTAHSRYKSDLLAFSDDTIKLNQDQKLGFH